MNLKGSIWCTLQQLPGILLSMYLSWLGGATRLTHVQHGAWKQRGKPTGLSISILSERWLAIGQRHETWQRHCGPRGRRCILGLGRISVVKGIGVRVTLCDPWKTLVARGYHWIAPVPNYQTENACLSRLQVIRSLWLWTSDQWTAELNIGAARIWGLITWEPTRSNKSGWPGCGMGGIQTWAWWAALAWPGSMPRAWSKLQLGWDTQKLAGTINFQTFCGGSERNQCIGIIINNDQ